MGNDHSCSWNHKMLVRIANRHPKTLISTLLYWGETFLLSYLWEKVHTESKYEDSYDSSPAWEMIIHKMLVRTAIREDPVQTASSEAVFSWSALFVYAFLASNSVFKILKNLPKFTLECIETFLLSYFWEKVHTESKYKDT